MIPIVIKLTYTVITYMYLSRESIQKLVISHFHLTNGHGSVMRFVNFILAGHQIPI